ncbi:MAG TPA: type II secretion system protein GspK [Pirellulaceae bacterium]|nr:type II secretion system protein GspK [Pirellulaceae bacterium]
MTESGKRRALVLILVLVVIVMLSLGAYSFTDLMIAHHEASQLTGRQVQTRALVDSGVEVVRVFLMQTEAEQLEAGGVFDNPDRFRGVNVVPDDDPNLRGSFTVLSPNLDDQGYLAGTRYGLEDESTRLNLNTLLAAEKTTPDAGRTFLMALPGMTEDVADAILDWLDADDEPRELGAEIDYYSGLNPPYAPQNGPLDTVEELLLVRGVTPQLLFGADVNRNGQLDPHEITEDGSGGSTDPEGFRGWSAYLTLHSLEWNVNPDGQPRVYLNQNDMQKLYDELVAVLPEEWATYIIAYRQSGPYTSTIRTATSAAGKQLDLTKPAKTPISQVIELVGSNVRHSFVGDQTPSFITSPFPDDIGAMNVYLPMLMDYVTVNPAPTIPGRINMNQASATVLAGIPGMTPEIVEQIISLRDVAPSSDRPARRHETWLLQEVVVDLPTMKLMMPFVTCGGDVYRAQVVGYYQGGQAASRSEVIFDATSPLPRLLFWRDISHLGRGYAVETLGVDFSEE